MNALPLQIGNENVYAGFWKRIGASFFDSFVLLPSMAMTQFIQSQSINSAIITVLVSSVLYAAYMIFFNAKFGATIGKMVIGIKITRPDGSKIGFKQALIRSSVYLIFSVVMGAAQIVAITHANPEIYLNAGWLERSQVLMQHMPPWNNWAFIGMQVWTWSQFIVFLVNKRKRAAHDLMAGTVVINRKFRID